MHLQIDVTRVAGHTVVSPQGEIDFATGPQLKDAITELLVAGEVHLVIDLLAVDFIESTGLGALIGGRRRAHAPQGLAGAGLHRAADAEDLPDHRPGQGVQDLRDGRGGHGSARAHGLTPGRSRFPKHRDFGDQV